MPATEARYPLAEIEQKVCDIAAKQLSIPRPEVSPRSRVIEDLHCDSLELVELLLEMEEAFEVSVPLSDLNPIYKSVFIRQPFRLADLAEMIYLQQGTGKPKRSFWNSGKSEMPPSEILPFTQLDGRWHIQPGESRWLFEALPSKGAIRQFRRRSDGMRCVLLPTAEVELGTSDLNAAMDEQPLHRVQLDSFVIDAEPVSTTAYCRFLNSVGDVDQELLADWFLLDSNDKRRDHQLVTRIQDEWRPIAGTERWPMILISWFGANAYSLWANGWDWHRYRDESRDDSASFLPTEAQWEYAARGPKSQPFAWGEAEATSELMQYGQHQKSTRYQADTLPLAAVNQSLGMSPFGLHHMAGNVWQWCRDWYDARFYSQPAAVEPNPVNRCPTQVRSERGGSWIGPASLCRSSYRRGRNPSARGRCLGFRCVSSTTDLPAIPSV